MNQFLVLIVTSLISVQAFSFSLFCRPTKVVNSQLRGDSFIVKYSPRKSSIYLVRNNKLFPIKGCSPVAWSKHYKKQAYLECQADGDAGYLQLQFSNRIMGILSFPEGNVGYQEDTRIPLNCSLF
jgi:hypothetical protein